MATLSIWRLADAGTTTARDSVQAMQQRELVPVLDAVALTLPAGSDTMDVEGLVARKGVVGSLVEMVTMGYMNSTAVAGQAFEWANGTLGSTMAKIGVTEDVLLGLRPHLSASTSILLVLTHDGTETRADEVMGDAELLLRASAMHDSDFESTLLGHIGT